MTSPAVIINSLDRGMLSDFPGILFRAPEDRLCPVERQVLGVLWSHSGADGWSWPSTATICKLAGHGIRKIRLALASLEAKDLIQRQEDPGHGFYYWIDVAAVRALAAECTPTASIIIADTPTQKAQGVEPRTPIPFAPPVAAPRSEWTPVADPAASPVRAWPPRSEPTPLAKSRAEERRIPGGSSQAISELTKDTPDRTSSSAAGAISVHVLEIRRELERRRGLPGPPLPFGNPDEVNRALCKALCMDLGEGERPTPEQILDCWQLLSDRPFYQGHPLSMRAVLEALPEFCRGKLRRGDPERQGYLPIGPVAVRSSGTGGNSAGQQSGVSDEALAELRAFLASA